jgi:hypothetical protein
MHSDHCKQMARTSAASLHQLARAFASSGAHNIYFDWPANMLVMEKCAGLFLDEEVGLEGS